MTNGFNQKINLTGKVQSYMAEIGVKPMNKVNLDGLDEAQNVTFKGVMSGLTGELNNSLNAPDKLLKDAMTGSNDVDIHDVMTAMAKAEISVNVATQITSKVIQAYDKIMQISV